jgi:magnesium transporter
MTVIVLANAESEEPVADVITFVLARQKLITMRFIDPLAFRTFATRCERGSVTPASADYVLMGILDVIVDRLADVLERIGADVDGISREIFNPGLSNGLNAGDFQAILRRLGRKNDLTGKMRESLLTIARMLSFLSQQTEGKPLRDIRSHIKTLTRDIQSLQDHSSHVTQRLGYLLDATLGLINIDQNNIIKIMSVAAIVFLPPTLFASIWGMNFHVMPELGAEVGYPIALVVIVISGILPYAWFKRRGWL